jgi:nitrogen regulatory protein P-II 1
MKLELAVKDEMVERVIYTILETAQTGKIGDGKIFVTNIEHIVRIRTGETDNEAI